mmetsp:Transcript_65227/g.172870  ORF Transcript_65227/g.172870 Transcript_65227/m.172870 type:complete len:982 (-) Transcript_65227:10-2955(-)
MWRWRPLQKNSARQCCNSLTSWRATKACSFSHTAELLQCLVVLLGLTSMLATTTTTLLVFILFGTPWLLSPLLLLAVVDTFVLLKLNFVSRGLAGGTQCIECKNFILTREPRFCCLVPTWWCLSFGFVLGFCLQLALSVSLWAFLPLADTLFFIGLDGMVEPGWRSVHDLLRIARSLHAARFTLFVAWLFLLMLFRICKFDRHTTSRRDGPKCCVAPAFQPCRPCWSRGGALCVRTPCMMFLLWGVWLLTCFSFFVWSFWDVLHLFWAEPWDCSDGICYQDCNPLSASRKGCLLPLPSSTWEDSSGKLWIPTGAMLQLRPGRVFDFAKVATESNGWSPLSTVLFEMPGLIASGLAGSTRLDSTVQEGSTTLLLRARTGQPVPHFAEYDLSSRPLDVGILQPAELLRPGERYVVVIQNLKGEDGAPLSAPPFENLWTSALPGGGTDDEISQEALRYRRQVLPVLELSGALVPNVTSVQLCWDFTVRSSTSFDSLMGVRAVSDWLLEDRSSAGVWDFRFRQTGEQAGMCSSAVEAALSLGDIEAMASDFLNASTQFSSVLHGRFSVPRILESEHRTARLRSDFTSVHQWSPDNLGSYFESYRLDDVGISVRVPCVLTFVDGSSAGARLENVEVERVLFWGHGVFNDRNEANSNFVALTANRLRALVVSVNLRGYSRHDLPVILRSLVRDPELLVNMKANVLQGFLSQASAVAWVKRNQSLGSMSEWLASRSDTRHIRLAPSLEVLYYGFSVGGILGAGLVTSIIPFHRAVLGAPGAPWTWTSTRNADFGIYSRVLLRSVYGSHHARLLLVLVTSTFDEISVAAMSLTRESLTPEVLIQAGLGDVLVPSLASETVARSFSRCSAFESAWNVNPHRDGSLWGIMQNDSDGVALLRHEAWLTEFLYIEEHDALPDDNSVLNHPTSGHGVHGCVRNDPYVMLQNTWFLETGEVLDVCKGAGVSHCVRKHADSSCERLLEPARSWTRM